MTRKSAPGNWFTAIAAFAVIAAGLAATIAVTSQSQPIVSQPQAAYCAKPGDYCSSPGATRCCFEADAGCYKVICRDRKWIKIKSCYVPCSCSGVNPPTGNGCH